MKPHCLACAAAIFFAGSVQAQVVEGAPDTYATSKRSSMQESFDKAYRPYPRAYGGNQASSLNDQAFQGLFKTDPRLLGGYELFPHVAIEAGYVHLYDRGFHRIDPGRENMSGALGSSSFSSHLAARYTVPLTDRLDLYGKVGIAYSALKGEDAKKAPENQAQLMQARAGKPSGVHARDQSDTGRYLGAGAQYRVDGTTTVDAQYGRHGDAAKTWGNSANSDSVRANLKMGF
ncbi:outer membrane beta-barrel protein [Massilia dura]|uniref:Outer membrane beta-barrel protein n=1 Tax=Pseudoduganella dura TaxID=321982 RepID=A0A6I3X9I6_9BURK|nr:outer membrane beta-barrel protein [Pseudoduganella dura]MUI13514.1 outer membrane beta-barrel protein [Pseudoduganella dura]